MYFKYIERKRLKVKWLEKICHANINTKKLDGYIAISVDFRAKIIKFSLPYYHYHNDKGIISSTGHNNHNYLCT